MSKGSKGQQGEAREAECRVHGLAEIGHLRHNHGAVTLVTVVLVAAQLVAAQVSIRLAGDSALVDASYRFTAPMDSVAFVLIRLPGQTIRSVSGGDLGIRVEPAVGLTRVTAGRLDLGSIRIRFVVRGRLDRVPVPVPSVAAAPGADRVEVRVLGLDPATRLADGFPRLRSAGDAGIAVMANLPSLIRVPPARGWSVVRLIDILVLGLVAGASFAWVIRLRRARPA